RAYCILMTQSLSFATTSLAFFLSLSCRMWQPQNHVDTGKHWVQNAFERISTELKDTVVRVRWEFQENAPEYRLYFQIAGQDEETLVYTRGTLRTCGKSDNEAVRRRVEAAIRSRLTRGATSAG